MAKSKKAKSKSTAKKQKKVKKSKKRKKVSKKRKKSSNSTTKKRKRKKSTIIGLQDDSDKELLDQIRPSKQISFIFEDSENSQENDDVVTEDPYSEMEEFEDESSYIDDFSPKKKSKKRKSKFYDGLDEMLDTESFSDYDYEDTGSEW